MSQSQPVRVVPDLTLLPGALGAPVARPVIIWLFGIAGLCFAIAVVGAITRLTESGLSMTEWKPLLQDIPPMSEESWRRVFALYQQSPQYLQVTHGMTLEEYKGIFWWEWVHRLIAQSIGVAFALPFLWFLATRQLPRRLVPYLAGLFVLGGFQGLLGWAMVASGLVDRPSVSHYRLAAHLSMDLTIYALTLWTAFYVVQPRSAPTTPATMQPIARKYAIAGLALLATTIVWGAFTAGLRAGLIYNTFPLMGGGLTPPDLLAVDPLWKNFVENRSAVQFTHRALAISTGLVLMALAYRLRAVEVAPPLRRLATILFLDVGLQIFLGVETVVNQVPVWLGAIHQANAILLLGLVVRTLFLLRKPYAPQARPRLVVVTGEAA
jgi:cytochrome c oxidase assembly protein subunit 15